MKMSKSVFKETTSAEEEAQTAAQQQRIYIYSGEKKRKNDFSVEMQMLPRLKGWEGYKKISLSLSWVVSIRGILCNSPLSNVSNMKAGDFMTGDCDQLSRTVFRSQQYIIDSRIPFYTVQLFFGFLLGCRGEDGFLYNAWKLYKATPSSRQN